MEEEEKGWLGTCIPTEHLRQAWSSRTRRRLWVKEEEEKEG